MTARIEGLKEALLVGSSMPDAERDELERFFAPIAMVLTGFAEQFNLRLGKYHQNGPGWDFSFRHPHGGVATIQVLKDSTEDILIAGGWSIDDEPSLERRIRWSDRMRLEREDPRLQTILEQLLKGIVSWEVGSWTEIVRGFADIWTPETRSARQTSVESYPWPRLGGVG